MIDNMRNLFIAGFPALIFIVLLSGCSSKKITFGAGEIYQMDREENLVAINKAILKTYLNYNSYQNRQIPLNKYIRHLKYELFVGIIVNEKFTEVCKSLKNNKEEGISLKRGNTYKVFYKMNNLFFIKAIINNPTTGNNYLFNYISPDSTVLRSIFNENTLEKKIILQD